MTIGIVFQLGAEVVEVRVNNLSILFRNTSFGQFVDIERIRLDKNGVLKEFPDLKDNSEWRKITIERFKEKIKNMETEMERANYVIEDLTKYGYVGKYLQRDGFRPTKL